MATTPKWHQLLPFEVLVAVKEVHLEISSGFIGTYKNLLVLLLDDRFQASQGFPEVLWSSECTTQLKTLLCDLFYSRYQGTRLGVGDKTGDGPGCIWAYGGFRFQTVQGTHTGVSVISVWTIVSGTIMSFEQRILWNRRRNKLSSREMQIFKT